MRSEIRGRRAAGAVASLSVVLALAIGLTACAPPTSTTPSGTTAPPTTITTTTTTTTTTTPTTTTLAVTPTPPVISGTARVGSTLTTTVGTWAGNPTNFAIQWESCDAALPTTCRDVGAGTLEYVVAASELGRVLRVRVTATGGHGAATQVSVAVGPVLSAVPAGSREGVWRATGTRRLCALLGSWTCGTPSNVTLTFSLVGDCDGTGGCRLFALTGSWGWSLSGGTTCMTALGNAYQASSGTVTATFNLDPDNTIGLQYLVPQSAIPPTAYITDARATRVGDVATAPLPCP